MTVWPSRMPSIGPGLCCRVLLMRRMARSVQCATEGERTQIQDWYRGVPRLVINPDGTTNRMSADGNGWITSTTDALQGLLPICTIRWVACAKSNRRSMRTSGPRLPSHSVRSRPMSTAFRRGTGESITPKGHGVRNLSRRALAAAPGARIRCNNVAGTQRWVRNAYDSEGRLTFTSYPSSDSTVATGTWTEYDALGRKTSSSQDSEQGLLITTIGYSSNATTTVVDPLGHQTITRFDAFEGPDYGKPAQIIRADGSKSASTKCFWPYHRSSPVRQLRHVKDGKHVR